MSVEFEIEAGDSRDVVLGVDAYTHRAIVDMQDNRGYGAGATFTADQLRQLRRFLEYCYPASEDPPHEPDTWTVKFPSHLQPESMRSPDAPYEAIIAWECARCGKWVHEYGPIDRSPCRPSTLG